VADTLQAGDSGPEVEQLQTQLLNLGYQVEVNSQYDEATTEAVRLYQQQNTLQETGIADLDTQNYVETHANQNSNQGYEEPAAAAEPELAAGEMSPDGAYQWDGQQWQPVNQSEEPASAEGADGGSQVGQLSPDGAYQWDGQQWAPVGENPQGADQPGQAQDDPNRPQVSPEEWDQLVSSNYEILASGDEEA
jgi:peptidoglycan hydrolase-like protein with peptidoglycan-binding domain